MTIYSYGLLLAASLAIGLQLARSRARSRGLDARYALDLGIFVIVAALLGAKLMLLVVELEHFRSTPADIPSLASSGGVFYGGLLLALAVAVWYSGQHRLPLWTACDVFAPAIALGYITGRLGCLAAGCCYGRPADVPWAVVFSNPVAAANAGTPLGIPLHPTQLYEAGAGVLILGVLLAFEHRGRGFAGRTFWGFLFLYALFRFVIEFYRGDARGVVFGAVSTSQFISLLLAPMSLAMLVYLARAMPPAPFAAPGGRRVAA